MKVGAIPLAVSTGPSVVGLVGGVIILVGFTVLYKVWRGAPAVYQMRERLQTIWPFPDSLLRGTTRALFAMIPMMGLALILILLGLVAARVSSSPAIEEMLQITIRLVGVGTGIFFLQFMLIIAFNRPKFLVPKAFRQEPGMIWEAWVVLRDAFRRFLGL